MACVDHIIHTHEDARDLYGLLDCLLNLFETNHYATRPAGRPAPLAARSPLRGSGARSAPKGGGSEA